MERFSRLRRLVGVENSNNLKDKQVTIVGIGAVGSYALEAITRAGVGNIRIVDYDKVNLSNVNRQLIALESTVGLSKVIAAKNRVQDINPSCKVETYETFVHHENLAEILDNKPDMVIDAIDSVSAKVALITTAHYMGLDIITSMGAAMKKDPAQIVTGDIFESTACHLARIIRKRLRRNGIAKNVMSVYSKEVVKYKFTASDEVVNDLDRGRNRRIMGSLPTITGIFGLTIANYVILKLME